MKCLELINYVYKEGYRFYINKAEMLNHEIVSDYMTSPDLSEEDFPILVKALGYLDCDYIPFISTISIKNCEDYSEFVLSLDDLPHKNERLKGRLGVEFYIPNEYSTPIYISIRITDFLEQESLTIANTNGMFSIELINLINKYRSNKNKMLASKAIIDEIRAEFMDCDYEIPDYEESRLVSWITLAPNSQGKWTFKSFNSSNDLFCLIDSLDAKYIF